MAAWIFVPRRKLAFEIAIRRGVNHGEDEEDVDGWE